MTEINDLDVLIANLNPFLSKTDYIFCTFPDTKYGDLSELSPIATFVEEEGLTLVISKEMAIEHKIPFSSCFQKITLNVHSGLNSVGLTATVSKCLANNGISANIIAAYHHDYIFVPSQKAQEALRILQKL